MTIKTARSADVVQPIAGFGISGFRTLHEVEAITPGHLTVICGPNNAGKSSLLEALELYPKLVSLVMERRNRDSDNEGPELSGRETAKIAIDLTSASFIELLMEHRAGEADAHTLAHAACESLGGPLWLHFNNGGDRGWQFDPEPTVKPLQDLHASWRRSRATAPPAVQAFLRAGGASQSSDHIKVTWVKEVAKKCLSVPRVERIPDIRREAEKPLSADDLWRLCQASARQTDGVSRIEEWAATLEKILQDVFGTEVRYEVRPESGSGDFRLRIDGQEDVPLDYVGAGVREVVAIAFTALKTRDAGVLAIEEPENCLHPVAVRRLVRALPRRAEVQLFVSTHASAVVNSDPDAVIHLTRTGATSTSRQVQGAPGRYEAVRSLGYSPADLVLTPCALWVEGPSDRLYLRAWLARENLVEGLHYQTMFFGGALAANVTTSSDTLPDQTLAAIRNLGRHCAVVVDSDRSRPRARLKQHVQRFKAEVDGDAHAHLLVTHGREIENYLPLTVTNHVRKVHGAPAISSQSHRYAQICDQRLTRKLGKTEFANQALEQLGDGSLPTATKRDIRVLADFIRSATVY